MRIIIEQSQFRRDLKRIKRSGICSFEEIAAVIALLQTDVSLPGRHKDHPLKGKWAPARECHIRPDLLLVYEKTPKTLYLLRIGTHSDLF